MIHLIPSKRKEKAPVAPKREAMEASFLVAEVMFGSPNRNCAGAGICKVFAPTAQEMSSRGNCSCKRAIALVSATPGRALEFRFVRQSMCRNVIKQQFGQGVFVVEDPFEFHHNHWLKGAQRIIQAGIYPVLESKDYFTVVFDKVSVCCG